MAARSRLTPFNVHRAYLNELRNKLSPHAQTRFASSVVASSNERVNANKIVQLVYIEVTFLNFISANPVRSRNPCNNRKQMLTKV